MLSTSLWIPFPSVNLGGATWPYRYNCLWPLPGLVSAQGAAARDAERRFVTEILDELTAKPPRLLAMDGVEVPQGFFSAFDLESYFRRDPRFRRFLQTYRLIDKMDRVSLFVRQPGAVAAAHSVEPDPPRDVLPGGSCNRGDLRDGGAARPRSPREDSCPKPIAPSP